jgi:hypothetical protein
VEKSMLGSVLVFSSFAAAQINQIDKPTAVHHVFNLADRTAAIDTPPGWVVSPTKADKDGRVNLESPDSRVTILVGIMDFPGVEAEKLQKQIEEGLRAAHTVEGTRIMDVVTVKPGIRISGKEVSALVFRTICDGSGDQLPMEWWSLRVFSDVDGVGKPLRVSCDYIPNPEIARRDGWLLQIDKQASKIVSSISVGKVQ